ncbi:hypothetical protein FQA39_LY02303 [Lamprigera yunnana]|nr:hypothetical protein FQA39_LY02303 [Lamprigera yunnana]
MDTESFNSVCTVKPHTKLIFLTNGSQYTIDSGSSQYPMEDIHSSRERLSIEKSNLSKWYILFGERVTEWISFKPKMDLIVYPCYVCRHMFSSRNSFLDHVNRRALVLKYKCIQCVQKLTFYNPCSFLLHVRQHFSLNGGQINLQNVEFSVLPFGLAGFLPDPRVPVLYNVEDDQVGETSVINTLFYSPVPEFKGHTVINFVGSEILFLFVSESNIQFSLSLKQISSNIPKCKFVVMDNNTTCPATAYDNGNEVQTHSNEVVVEVKRELEDSDTENCGLVIAKVETLTDKTKDISFYPKCPECGLVQDVSMGQHFLLTNKPFDEDLKCDACKYIAPTKCSLQAHERIHQNSPPYVCPECGKAFESGHHLQAHLQEVCFHSSKQVRLRCPGKKCGKVFAQILTFSSHFATHMKHLHKCPHCYEIYVDEGDFFRHRKEHDSNLLPDLVFGCTVCNEVFPETAFADHIYDHATNKKECVYVYICKHCRSYFRSTTTYANHLLRCTKLAARSQPNINLSTPKSKKSISHILRTCSRCKMQIKDQISKLDNMVETCPNCDTPFKNKSINTIFTKEFEGNLTCLLCNASLEHENLDSHFNCISCKKFKPKVVLEHIPIKEQDEVTITRSELTIRRKRRKPWSYYQNQKQRRASMSFEHETINIETAEPIPFNGIYYCKLCSFQSTDRTEFHSHIIPHRSGSTANQCMECGECFVVKPSLAKHLVYYHQVEDVDHYFKENECFDKLAVEELGDRMHLPPSDSIDGEIRCRICTQQFDNLKELSIHFRSHGMAFLLKNSK